MSSTPTIRIILVDDHRLFSDGLCSLLERYDQVDVIEQVYHSPNTFRSVETHQPDVILMDFNMPQLNGMQVARQLLETDPTVKIIILSMYNEIRYVEDFEKLGIKGYLLKTASVDEVVAAIEQVYQGKVYFEGAGKAHGNHHSEDYFLKKFRLTTREVKIIRLIRSGISTADIAEQLSISHYTVETHRKNICTKLDLKGKNELLRFAIENDI
jgi:DNA-binding NarL/FixJ family response regulator